jgi:hypothetical protein
MKKERIEKAVEILNYATKNQISVKEASVKCGYSDTYVKNIKALAYDEYYNGILEDELFELFNQAYEEYKYYRGFSIKEDNIINKEKSDGKTTITGKGNEMEVEWKTGSNYPVNHIKTLDELLEVADVDLDIWKVKDFVINKWDVTSWKKENPETIQNFQVKARLEKDVQLSEAIDIQKIFADMAQTYKPPILNVTPKLQKKSEENNLLEISIFDLHFGKLAWHGETGEDYDIKIASKRFINAIETLLRHASGFPITRILFPVGNDFFNSDNMFDTTSHQTSQDEDVRWQKTFTVGVKLLVDGINILKQIGVPIDIIVIPGNHDFERSYYMGSYLEAWFNGDEQVCVNNDALPRKYYKHGNVLLGFTHGSEEKENSLPLLMASDIESKPYWSNTLYHEFHIGHIHRKKDIKFTVLDKAKVLSEDLGVTVRYLSSLTGTDQWHFSKGFIGAIKAADGFIWNDKTGLLAHLNANLNID